jgi:hypothetical protein
MLTIERENKGKRKSPGDLCTIFQRTFYNKNQSTVSLNLRNVTAIANDMNCIIE